MCNVGSQSRIAYCTSHHRGHIIDDKYCEHISKENLEQSCNTHDCPKWQLGDDSSVSVVVFFSSPSVIIYHQSK